MVVSCAMCIFTYKVGLFLSNRIQKYASTFDCANYGVGFHVIPINSKSISMCVSIFGRAIEINLSEYWVLKMAVPDAQPADSHSIDAFQKPTQYLASIQNISLSANHSLKPHFQCVFMKFNSNTVLHTSNKSKINVFDVDIFASIRSFLPMAKCVCVCVHSTHFDELMIFIDKT